jgi:hypothetical protein
MPKNTKANTEETPAEEKNVVEKVVEKVKAAAVSTCGHVNKQHYNTKGKLEDLACDLEPKHAGDHHAKYRKNVGEPVTDEKGRVVRVDYHEEEADAYWNDAAGKPAASIHGREVEQTSLLQKDLIMQVMKENPHLTVEQATAQAKALPQWNAAALG